MREYLLCAGGKWRAGRAGSAPAVSPSSGDTCPSGAGGPAPPPDAAVAAARSAWPDWAARSAFERAQWCGQVVAAMAARASDLAHALVTDQGKPRAEAVDEVTELAE